MTSHAVQLFEFWYGTVLESLPGIVWVSANMRIFLTGRLNVDDEIMECFGEVVRVLYPLVRPRIGFRVIWRWGCMYYR